MDFGSSKVSNKYLSHMEEWEETGVRNYKKKIRLELFAPWLRALVLLAIYFAFTMVLWVANVALQIFEIPEVFNILTSSLTCLILIPLFVLISVIAAMFSGKRRIQRFVIDNRGEVGHVGKPYSNKLKVSFVISIIVFAVGLIGTALFDLIMFEWQFNNFISMDLLGTMSAIIGAAAYPLVFNIFALIALKGFNKDVCPSCGRSNYRMVKSSAAKNEDKLLSKQVSYTPGKIAYVYGQFMIDNTIGSGDEANSFITYCRYCSFFVQGTGSERFSEDVFMLGEDDVMEKSSEADEAVAEAVTEAETTADTAEAVTEAEATADTAEAVADATAENAKADSDADVEIEIASDDNK